MIAVNSVLFLFLVVSSVVCQYVPLTVWFPTLNGSLNIPSNYSNYNKSYGSPNLNNTTTNRPPYHLGNISNHSTPYNGSEDGHLVLGSINASDKILFDQVCIFDFIIKKIAVCMHVDA